MSRRRTRIDDIELAVDAGLDALRVHGHIAPRHVYDAADELGMLLLQDFPLQWGYARSVRGQAVTQARAAVDMLGHHPSIVQWNAHNEPTAVAVGIEGDGAPSRLRYLAGQQLPSWNKTVLDRWVKRSLERADPTRLSCRTRARSPTSRCSTAPTATSTSAGTTATSATSRSSPARVPRVVRFVSEFGAQAVPESADFIDHSTWPDLDWEHLAVHHGLQKWVFDERVPPAISPRSTSGGTPPRPIRPSWSGTTSRCCAGSSTGRPADSACSRLNDPGTDGVVELARPRPGTEAGWAALRHACQPLIVVADRPPSTRDPGRAAPARRARGQRPPRRGRPCGRRSHGALGGRRAALAVRGRGRRRRVREGRHDRVRRCHTRSAH